MVHVEVSEPLAALAEPSTALHHEACEAVARGVGELAAVLGVPTRPAVDVSVGSVPQRALLRLVVGERRLRCSNEMLQRVYSCVVDQPLDFDATPQRIGEQ